MPDEEVWESRPISAWHDPLEVALDLHRIVVAGEAKPLREPSYVRVDNDSLRVAQLGCDDVSGLTRNARKLDEVFESSRNLPVELLEQYAHRAAYPLRLLAKEASRIDVALELLDRNGEVVLRRAIFPEEGRRDAVDVRIRRLGREHHRDEELEIRPKTERDLRVLVLDGQPLDDLSDPLTPPSEPATPGLRDVATRHGRLR